MKEGPDIARIGSLIGDPARANMLCALMSGKALTATELANEAGVTIQTASSHLSKLEASGLVGLRKQGRHRYYVLVEDVARTLEGIMGLAASKGHLRTKTGPKDAALKHARICYDHLAGDYGVLMLDNMKSRGFIAGTDESLELTPEGSEFVASFGIDVQAIEKLRRPMCLCCLDWSARRSHLAGGLGSALLSRFFDLGWVSRQGNTRALLFSQEGKARFMETFGSDGGRDRRLAEHGASESSVGAPQPATTEF